MPEYLAPGVYLEETSFRSRSIEGVSTSTTAFVGPTATGPVGGNPELLTSFADFERIYGGFQKLAFGGAPRTNYLAHAVKAYFDNGGGRLYVSRAFKAGAGGDGKASASVITDANADLSAAWVARFAGAAGDVTVTVRELRRPISGQQPYEVFHQRGSATDAPDEVGAWVNGAWVNAATPTATLAPDPAKKPELVSLAVSVTDASGRVSAYDDLHVHPDHPRFIGAVLTATPSRRADELLQPVALTVGKSVTATALRAALLNQAPKDDKATGETIRWGRASLSNGSDGAEPDAGAYIAALKPLSRLDDISIIAAPGSVTLAADTAIRAEILTHVGQRGLYRVAILDAPANQSVSTVREYRGGFDSDRAALYHPWVVVANPVAKQGDPRDAEIAVPPSGFVAGIYARNDVTRGVWKAPANEVLRGALRPESELSFAENEVLNPVGVNCIRSFPNRGLRVWGARTASSDPEWKYISLRRYFHYLEASIDRGTQWAVFEPNGASLWANVRETISSFLYNEFISGALLGSDAREAYFVRCDRSTMTQNDLDNGRLICLVGVAVVKPAEFVIFRIGQRTATARD